MARSLRTPPSSTGQATTRRLLQTSGHGGRAAAALLLASLLLGGCGGAPKKPVEATPEEEVTGITVAERGAIDSGARADFNRALVHLEKEEYQAGIELLETVVLRAPEVIAPRVNLAIAYGRLGDLERAEESLRLALEVNPEHPVANNEYGMLLRRAGRFAEARTIYEALLNRYPEFHPARKNLGILCDLYLNEPHCALEHYEIYIEAVPTDEPVQLWIVDLRRRTGG